MSSDQSMTANAAQVSDLARLLPGVMFSQRRDLTFSFVSAQISEFTGLSAAEWFGQPPERFWEIVHEADVEELQQQLKHAAESTELLISTFRVRHSVTKRVTCIQERRQGVRDATGSLLRYECLWLDMTQQMISEKLHAGAEAESMMRLGEVLVHDFNNCMTGIHALCETCRLSIEAAHPSYENLALLQQNAKKARSIFQRIVDLVYGNPGKKAFHDLNELMDRELELVRGIVSRRIHIETAFARESLPVYVDPTEFRQIIIKLTVNAINAMPQGGTLGFVTSRHDDYPPLLHRRGNWPRLPSFCLAVTDTGSGVPECCLHGIFDAFSESKPLSQVQSLGLYAVGQFVEKQNGCITVESEENKRTTFRIWLPEADFKEV